jgi:diguanylate cyclase (GGDEF)-like protein/PAS domain S-box-containing protein
MLQITGTEVVGLAAGLGPSADDRSPAFVRMMNGLAATAPPVVVVTTRPSPDAGPQVVWMNPAADRLLIADLASSGATPDDPSWVHDGRPHWLTVVASILGDEAQAGQWHTATVRSATGLPVGIRLNVAPMSDGVTHFVWLQPVDDDLLVATEMAAEAERRFQLLARSAPVGIFVSDVGARLSFVNISFASVFGRDAAELVGTGWLDSFASDDLPRLLAGVEQACAGAAVDLTLRMYGAARSRRWVRLRLIPVATHPRGGGFVGTLEDVTRRRERELQLSYEATHDSLTGLINRRRLIEMLTESFDLPDAQRRDMALLFCDLDGFKAINDRFGHDAGDRVLIQMAKRLTTGGREDDVVARLAGDEFVVVLYDVTTLEQGEAAAARRRAALSRPLHIGADVLEITASVGVALFSDHCDAMALLRAADSSMYRAKAAPGAVASARGTESGAA